MSNVQKTMPYRKLFSEAVLKRIGENLNDNIHSISSNNFFINIDEIIKAFGLSIKEDKLSDEISGQLKDTTIIVNRNHSENRKRFTKAHEFAHYILKHNGSNYRTLSEKEYKNPNDYYNEIEANAFAADILMPAIQIETLYEKFLDINNLDQSTNLTSQQKQKLYEYVASKLKVSESAASYRLINLGLI
ncbi:ImmA/IrrE family metallo-endopeptidase [Staphylococcus xylosus]|uniref:ImmA/IrrE family metallo-endopeptidase n=1 Tax=Staphylococcus xylosus TaxID=1288 RepID=UPI003F56A7F2